MSQRMCITFGPNESIILPDGLTSLEMEQVHDWTEYKNRSEWFDGIANELLPALKAALLILRKRNGDTTSKFAEVRFNFDDLNAYFIDETGREIEPDVVYDDDGDPVMLPAKPGTPSRAKVNKHADGSARWIYTDTKEPVPVPPTKQDKPAALSATTPA